ncbi:hypothetical protein HDU90_003544 [Geranomyces variabilis]|nr:hypothetical protein HDU90_003544 [Geranomyces variabilis]
MKGHYYWCFNMDDPSIISPGENVYEEAVDITASEYGPVEFVQVCDGSVTDPGQTSGTTPPPAARPWPGHCKGDICARLLGYGYV